MFGLNTYFATTNARDYLDQLLGRSSAATRDQEPAVYRPPSFDAATGTTATDRAMAKIASLIWEMENGGKAEKTSVDDAGGYVLNARGTEEGDTIDIKAISAFNIASGGGDDTVTIKAGSVAGLDAGEGDDQINLAAGYLAEIDGGDGTDTIRIAGDLVDGVSGGSGDDVIKVSAETMLGIAGGDGNDTLHLEGRRIFASGGAGDDTFTIKRSGNDGDVELSFGRGDGKDVVNSDGAIDIRLTSPGPGAAERGTANASLSPDDVDIAVSGNSLVLRIKETGDMMTINFAAGALEDKLPRFDFTMDNGNYVLRIR